MEELPSVLSEESLVEVKDDHPLINILMLKQLWRYNNELLSKLVI